MYPWLHYPPMCPTQPAQHLSPSPDLHPVHSLIPPHLAAATYLSTDLESATSCWCPHWYSPLYVIPLLHWFFSFTTNKVNGEAGRNLREGGREGKVGREGRNQGRKERGGRNRGISYQPASFPEGNSMWKSAGNRMLPLLPFLLFFLLTHSHSVPLLRKYLWNDDPTGHVLFSAYYIWEMW